MKRTFIKSSASMLALAVSATTTYAQESAERTSIEEIVVSGVRGSLLRALSQKRDATGFVDAVASEDLGKFPDINLAESLQRVPGITLNRDEGGRGNAVNLRGLGPEFTRVEINGMTAPVSGNSRAFSFLLLPAELFTNVAVHKTVRARDAEGGLAGLIQLSTPKPLDGDDFELSASVQGDNSENASDLGGRAALLTSRNFDDKFGVSLGLVYTDQSYQANQAGGFSVRPLGLILTPEARATATPEQLAARATAIQHYIHDAENLNTFSVNLGTQWRPSDTVEVSFNGLYSNRDSDRFLTRADAPSEGNVSGFSDLVIENGLVTSGTFSGVQQRLGNNDFSEDEDLLQISSSVSWKPSESWEITPFVGYTKRDIERVNNLLSYRRADLTTGEFINADVSYTYDGDFVNWTTTGTDFSSRPEEFLLNVFLLRPNTNDDEDLTTKLDFEYTPNSDAWTALNFGVRYSDRELSRTFRNTLVLADTDDRRTLPTLADALTILDDFDISGAPSSVPGNILGVDPVAALNQFAPNGLGGAPIDGARFLELPLDAARGSFSVQEETFNAYVEATFKVENLTFNAGFRLVQTDQSSSGFSITNGVASPITVDSDYQAFLPSISARYEINDDLLLRTAYSQSLTRPSLSDLAPTENISGVDEGGGTGNQGNPNLLPFTSDNFDIALEWYFGDEGYLSGAFFYKDIDDIIDTETFTEDRTFPRQRDAVLVTAPIVFTRPANGVSATILGFEMAGQLPFSAFVEDGVLSNFGMFANYTFNDSDADFSAEGDIRSTGLPGLSKNSYNIALYYDDGSFDARVAYAWRDEFLAAFSGAFGVPRFQNSRGQLDLSANYKFTDNLVAQFQVLNATNEQRIQTTSELMAPNNVRQLDRRILFGLRYTL
ncbi:TonB-dependent receptor [Porticoccus sp. GXU_MW_L64]